MKPVKAEDLLRAAELLAAEGKRPKEVFLRRAISNTYYAVFHTLAGTCADVMIGTSGADRSQAAWAQVYRALNHGEAKQAADNSDIMSAFPLAVRNFAGQFTLLQAERHKADYDPAFKPYRRDVLQKIQDARAAIFSFRTAAQKDKRAFAAHVLLRRRR